jgi:hypothetical protein
MRSTDQKKFIEALKRYERKFTPAELKDYKMFLKRQMDDEDLDNISFKRLNDLYVKYYANRVKPDINDIFKKK